MQSSTIPQPLLQKEFIIITANRYYHDLSDNNSRQLAVIA